MAYRVERVEKIIERELASILFDSSNNKLKFVSITKVSLTSDLSLATVYYTVLGNEGEIESTKEDLEKLNHLLEFCAEADKKTEALPKIISGKDVMQIMQLKPSKQIGEILEIIEEKRFEGEILTKKDAIEFLKKLKK